jgi:hypothetical protein
MGIELKIYGLVNRNERNEEKEKRQQVRLVLIISSGPIQYPAPNRTAGRSFLSLQIYGSAKI